MANVDKFIQSMFSLFHAPRRYPRIYAPHYESMNFYAGREKWVESIADIPVEAVHLFSTHWLHLEVYNGGFWQYFANSTGIAFPEAASGFGAIGMPRVKEVVERAAEKLGEQFPFDSNERRRIVGGPQNRLPFDDLDKEFYELADTKKIFRREPKFVPFAEAYADRFEGEHRG